MNNKKEYILALFIFVFLDIILFWKFYIKGFIPFPGDYLLAWYEPWKTDHTIGTFITIVHKPIADDVFRQLTIYKVLTAHLFAKFQFPLWNPYNGAGMPLMATMHSGFLNPFNGLFLFFPPTVAWGMYIAIQAIFVGFFTYVYSRKINLSPQASFFSSIAFTLSGFVVVRLIFGEYIYVVLGLPILLYLIECFLQNPQTHRIYFFPLVIFFLFISGQPQIIFYILFFSYLYFIFQNRSVKSFLVLSLIYLLGIGLSMIQLAPTGELFLQSGISPTSSHFIFNKFLLSITQLVTIIIPNYFGNQATYNYWGGTDYIETITYIGSLPVFFALFAFRRNSFKIDRRKFYFFAILLTIFSTLSWFGTKAFFSLPIPIIATGIPSRIFVLTGFSLAILSGYGFEKWLQTKNISKGFIYTTCAYCLILLIIFMGTISLLLFHIPCKDLASTINCRLVAFRNSFFEIVFFFICLAFIFLFFKRKILFARYISYLLIIFLAFVGLYNANKFLPFSSRETFFPKTSLITIVKEKSQYDRVFGLGQANIKTDFASFFHIYDPNYYDPLYNKRFGELVSYANTGIFPPPLLRSDVEIISEATISANLLQRRDRLFNLLSVKYLIFKNTEVNPTNTSIWKDNNWNIQLNQHALAHVYFVNNLIIENDTKKILQKLFSKDFDPSFSVILENLPKENIQSSKSTSNDFAKIIEYKENTLRVRTNVSAARMLVVTDNMYPGWKAFVDGKETTVYRANYTFRAVVIPEGEHTVTFSYQPLSLLIGICFSFVSIILICILYLLRIFFH